MGDDRRQPRQQHRDRSRGTRTDQDCLDATGETIAPGLGVESIGGEGTEPSLGRTLGAERFDGGDAL